MVETSLQVAVVVVVAGVSLLDLEPQLVKIAIVAMSDSKVFI